MIEIGIIAFDKHFLDFIGYQTRRCIGRKAFDVVPEARIEKPAKRFQPIHALSGQNVIERRLHECSGRFAAEDAFLQIFALYVFIAVPNGGVPVFAWTNQGFDVFERGFDTRLLAVDVV